LLMDVEGDTDGVKLGAYADRANGGCC